MSYFVTRVHTQWSPNADYDLPGHVILRPAGRITIDHGCLVQSYPDSLFFISQADSAHGHRDVLKDWLRFHDFALPTPWLFDDAEQGRLSIDGPISDLGMLHSDGPENRYPVDYDDIAHQLYFYETPDLRISYKDLFERFLALTVQDRNLVNLYDVPLHRGIYDSNWQFADYAYLKITFYVTILEVLIGHPPNCSSITKCTTCAKPLTHREGSEAQWRAEFIEHLLGTTEIAEQYAALIDAAYHEVRHPTVHAAGFPTVSFVMPEAGLSIYDTERTTQEFKADWHALQSLQIGVRHVTRSLMLNKLFGLTYFPPVRPLHSKTFRSGDGAESLAAE